VRPDRSRAVNLAVLLVVLAALASLLEGPAVWLGALIVGAAAAFGAFHFLAEVDPRGVPIESLATPAVAAMALAGMAHLAGVRPALAAILRGGGLLLVATLLLEARLMGPADDARARRERQLVPVVVLLAFLGFASGAGAVSAGRAAPLPGLRGPASLAGIFYLGSAYRAAPGAERRSAGWLWEYLVLALALAGVVAWNLLVREGEGAPRGRAGAGAP